MKKIGRIITWIVLLWAVISIPLLITGKFYYWKALVYNYVDIDDLDLFYSRTVKAPAPRDWNVSTAYNSLPLSDTLSRELEAFGTVAFLVIRDDSIVSENYWDGYDAASLSNSFSMAKSFVGTLVGIALATRGTRCSPSGTCS